ncbi:hypothetical protein, partial [Brucella sp. 10RB9214]|uniref:hypothetical protein n=1 Tax=Brucella sp. 10RB9214 TaxID=1844040 RepID=UPI0019D68FE6
DDKPNSLQALLNGIKILSSRYILDNERLLHFTEKSFHISTYRPTIDTIINHLYQELKEDYNVIINYEQTSYDKLATPSFVGRAHLNHIYLGGFFTTKIYLINIRVVNPSSTETEKKAINNIKERIKSLVEKSKRLKAIIDISPSNPE